MGIIIDLLTGTTKLRDAWPKINTNFTRVKTEVDAIVLGSANAEVGQAHVSTAKSKTFAVIDDRFEEIETDLADNTQHMSLGANDKDIYPEILDMHYDTLKGIGWNSLESGGELIKSITVIAIKGTFDLTLSSVTSLFTKQLIVIYTDGEYYPNVIKSIVGNIVTLMYPLKKDIAVNDTFHNFYINSTHPNIYGYKAIADETLRNVLKPRGQSLLFRILPTDYTFSGTGTNNDGGFIQDYTQPFAVFDTKVLTETRQGIKVITLDNDCFMKIVIHLKAVDGASINFQISNLANSIAYYIKNYTELGDGTSDKIVVSLFLRKGSYNFKIKNLIAGKSFALGKTEVFKLSDRYDLKTFDKGVHLLLGDSWFEVVGINERLAERFPNATFINFGVGGNTSDALVRRFNGTATDADIKDDPTNYGDRKDATTIPIIDYVWVMCGTNDYNQSVTDTVFKANIDTLVKDIINIGAKPLIFNSSVGQISVASNFTLSRQYADIYFNKQYSVTDIVDTYFEEGGFVPTIAGSTTAGANTYDIQEGIYRKIGKTVTFALRVRMSTKDVSIAGLIKVIGLPYNPIRISALALSRADYVLYGATGRQIVAQAEINGEIIINKIVDNGSILAVVASDVANNTMFYVTGTYPIL